MKPCGGSQEAVYFCGGDRCLEVVLALDSPLVAVAILRNQVNTSIGTVPAGIVFPQPHVNKFVSEFAWMIQEGGPEHSLEAETLNGC